MGGGGSVEGDAESDLDVPAGDADFVDDESEQLLSLLEIEPIEGGGGGGGEAGDSLAEPVACGEFGAFVGEGLALLGEC